MEDPERLTESFTDHENQADDGGHIQPLPGNFLLPFAILLRVAVVVAMSDAIIVICLRGLLVGHAGCTLKIKM